MSKIVSPYPPIFDIDLIVTEPGTGWWELRLYPNENGDCYTTKTDAKDNDITTATWYEFEFFDGYNTIIDTGFDKPTRAYIDSGRRNPDQTWIAVLSVDPPTPAPGWKKVDPQWLTQSS